MEEFLPWIKYPGLSAERLSFVASRIKHARAGCAALHDPESGDSSWSLGCRSYSRSCHELRVAAHQHDWLEILPDPMPLRMTFTIAARPIRFYRGDTTTVPQKYLSQTTAEQQQLLLFDDLAEFGGASILRLAVLTNEVGEVLSVRLVEFNTATKLPTGSYDIDLDSDGALTSITSRRVGVTLPPVAVGPLHADSADAPRRPMTGTRKDE
jgi:hypothetical protein